MVSCVIVVPIYKETLTFHEEVSLKRLIKVNKENPVVFVAPKGLLKFNYSQYLARQNYSLKYFDSRYFKSISTYNRLLLSTSFYKCFLNFEFILIYQLDAFIFHDNLNEWCEKGYDYIGAPWFDFKKAYNFYVKMRNSSNPAFKFLKRIIYLLKHSVSQILSEEILF